MTADLVSRRCFLAGLCAAPLPAWAAPQPAPLLLAVDAPPEIDPRGYLVSEKYDGVRAWWDGQALRFRSGLPIAAPDWFVAALPRQSLDGELWLARGRFEALVAAVRRQTPRDDEWRALRYMVFELPGAAGGFAARAERIRQIAESHGGGACVAVQQQALPDRAALAQRLQGVLDGGGEGLVLHRADAAYVTGRSSVLLKLKPLADAEAEVTAHLPGRGKHQGRLGALRLRTAQGVVFDIGTGFSDAQRASPPPLGAWVTYTHRGWTAAGVPRFASFSRVRWV